MKLSTRQVAILELVKSPVEQVFSQCGIRLKKSKTGYWNLSRCPWCEHGTDTKPNFQCGVRETASVNGFRHSVKCQHPHDSPDGNGSPHYVDILSKLGLVSEEECIWLKNLRSEIHRQRLKVETVNSGTSIKLGNTAYNTRLQKRLDENPGAVKWLTVERGFSVETIKHFRLGLTEAYVPAGFGKTLTENALAAPLLDRTGRFLGKYVNYSIPGVTEDNRVPPRRAWSAGSPCAY